MSHRPFSRTTALCLGLALVLGGGCNDDEVIADYTCGDGECNEGEDLANCAEDCGPPCGDDLCESGENAVSCPADCAGPQYPGPCLGDSVFASGDPGMDSHYAYDIVDGELYVTRTTDMDIHVRLDDEGRLIANAWDTDGDGVWEWVATRAYDANGRLSTEQTLSADWTQVLTETTHTYDATGYRAHTTTMSVDTAGEPLELISEITYEWNADNTHCVEHVDEDIPGATYFVNEVTYDATGNVIHRENHNYGTSCDFLYDQENLHVIAPSAVILLPYDDIKWHVRLIEYRCLENNSQANEFGERYYYDERGNMTHLEFYHFDDQPTPTHTFTYDYSCWE